MNKPASKEPSMDEILSSIRQIIADDDAATPRTPPAARPAPEPVPRAAAPAEEPEPLALKPEQIIRDDEEPEAADVVDEAEESISFSDLIEESDTSAPPPADRPPPQLVDPEDVTFEAEDDEDPMEPVAAAEPEPEPEPEPAPPVAPPPRMAPPPPPRPTPSPARAAPMPDPTLSQDMAEQLLEPTTDAAVKSTFAKLNGMSAVGSTVTLEALMRDMLRPMLKEWLDENLPSVVERMVEKEIARISRGGE